MYISYFIWSYILLYIPYYILYYIYIYIYIYILSYISSALRAPSRHVPWTWGTEAMKNWRRDLKKKRKWNPKSTPETMKILVPGAVLEPSGAPQGGLGVSGGASWDFWRDLEEIFGEVGAKMGPRWSQDGPSWQHDSAKMTMLGSVREVLGGILKGF